MITVESSGSFQRSGSFLTKLLGLDISRTLHMYGRQGVAALAAATPVETGETAALWGYVVSRQGSGWSITWTNSHVVNGAPVAIMLQYGHGTGTGGYVEGRDFINPVIKPIFDKIAEDVWKAVTAA